ncbi:hypothetical protein ACFL43_05410 [Thermodesulfobacteriota bacterium]
MLNPVTCKTAIAVLAICAAACFCTPRPATAQSTSTLTPALLTRLLIAGGIDARGDILLRDGALFRAVRFAAPDDTEITVGVPLEGLRPDTPFLLSSGGIECMLGWSASDGLTHVAGDSRLISQGVFDVLDCILETVFEMVENFEICGADAFCIVDAALMGSILISLCPLYIL